MWIDNAKQGAPAGQSCCANEVYDVDAKHDEGPMGCYDAGFVLPVLFLCCNRLNHNFLTYENCSTSEFFSRIYRHILGGLGVVCDHNSRPLVYFWVVCDCIVS